jgi:hypothetical protein
MRVAFVRLLAIAAAAGAVVPAPALAARNLKGVPDNLTEQVRSDNFVVHYTSAPGDPNAIAPEGAQQLLATAERALGDTRTRLSMPQPLDDGDGRSDIYVYRVDRRGERGTWRADSTRDQTSGWIAIPPDAAGDIVTVTHQVVHLQQLALYRPAGMTLAEGSATWAPLHLYAGELGRLPDAALFLPDDPLDCESSSRCGRPGHGAWRFFQHLSERHGAQIVRALYDRSRALGELDHRPHFREAIDAALEARQTTLPRTFSEFTAANLVGGYELRGLARRRYGATEPHDDMATGARTRRFRARSVTLDHLSGAYYRFRSGSDLQPVGARRCRRAVLRLRLEGPADLEEPLYWAPFRPRRGSARAVALRRGRAVVEVPWSTCGGREVGLAFQNPSPSMDERRFVVRPELRVRR